MDDKLIEIINREIIMLAPYGESEPFRVEILKSGWNGRYHVITEWGDTGEYTHRLLSPNQINEIYGVDITSIVNDKKVFQVTKEEILNLPNDADLGEFLRKKIN